MPDLFLSRDNTQKIPITILDVEAGPARERGLRDIYLREIRLQCRFARSALERALNASTTKSDGDDEVWASLQASLAAAAIVSRLLVGDDIRGDQAAARERGKKLRAALATEDQSPILDRRLRNHLEHLDQRLDDLARDERTTVIIDRFITDGLRPILYRNHRHSEEAPLSLLRVFAPRDGFVVFRGDSYDLFALRSELCRLEQRAEKLLREPMPRSNFATPVYFRLAPWGRIDESGIPIEGDPYQ